MTVPNTDLSAASAQALAVLSSLGSAHLSAIAEAAIFLLDQRSGDCDLEDDDPAGDPLDIFGEFQSDDGREMFAMMPKYGADQTLGPINEAEARRAHHLMERLAA
jgi:hypothetical protein